jgi:hypothetical protein
MLSGYGLYGETVENETRILKKGQACIGEADGTD